VDRWFDVGQEAEGFIAIGQMATGVIAIGQVAFGVIAIGQVSRGVIAIGQAAIGIVSVGMVGAGVGYTVALMGVGGVAGPGFVLPLVPRLPKRAQLPPTISAAALAAGRVAAGWLQVRIEPVAEGDLRMLHGDEELPVRFARRVWHLARGRAVSPRHRRVLAYVERGDEGLLCTRLMEIPPRRSFGCITALLQFAGLCGIAIAFWLTVAQPLGAALLR
jgi:hypothetical protein